MPTYDYKCTQCEHVFEKFHGMTEVLKFDCPKCSSANVEKQISGGSGIHFKGSGFYVTDYKNKKPKSQTSQNKPVANAASSGAKTTQVNSKKPETNKGNK